MEFHVKNPWLRLGGGTIGAFFGAGAGAVKGVIEAYEEWGRQIHVEFQPAK